LHEFIINVSIFYSDVTFNTMDGEVLFSSKGVIIDKQYFTFELKTCTSTSIITVSDTGIYFSFEPTITASASNVNGLYRKITIELGLNCATYKKFKISWIHGSLTLWHIRSSKWEAIHSGVVATGTINSSTIKCFTYHNNFAEWRVFYYGNSFV